MQDGSKVAAERERNITSDRDTDPDLNPHGSLKSGFWETSMIWRLVVSSPENQIFLKKQAVSSGWLPAVEPDSAFSTDFGCW